ncbi:MAG TPA: cyclic nucleotide-binding domain-containing protein [Chthoniobacterales bacterium]|nr:cyclic nucleotide-binding domain-containing protein [Chthoniobacterales bacterium]
MRGQDFFGFCTTLKPLERKALGELSEVRHLEQGEIVYSPGDPADSLYIINRGVVEVGEVNASKKTAYTYLSRGDVFGDIEALSGLPRRHLVRTHEVASLQCFQRKDFSELIQRIPSFFLYLSKQLALRLWQADDVALAQSHCMELSGSLSNFDLVTIYQTILSSFQTGELQITDEKGDPVSSCFFENGQPRTCQFEHLTGEEALWQLFLSENLPGSFSFSSGEKPSPEQIVAGLIDRDGQELLIQALQARDEFADFKRRVPEPNATVRRRQLNISWPENAPEALRPLGEEIWQIVYSNPLAISELFRRCQVSELTLYRVVDELVQSQHFELLPARSPSGLAA